MIKFSKKVEYALIALVYISEKEPGHLTTAKELSIQLKISHELMAKILQRLALDKFIISVQGAKGGYFLAKRTDQITLGSIINSIDGVMQLADCTARGKHKKCKRYKNCNIKNKIGHIQTRVDQLFDEITMKDFKNKTNEEDYK